MSIKYNGKLIAGKYKTQIVTDATESNKGLIRIATLEEINAGTDNTTAITPKDLATKQNTIPDLDTIRQGATLGSTALQSIPDEYITETELNAKGYLTSYTESDPIYISDKPSIALKSEIPTKTSQLTNDSGYLTQSTLPVGSNMREGIVQVDGTTITAEDGIISAVQQDLTPYLTKDEAMTTYETVENAMSVQEELQSSIDTKANINLDNLSETGQAKFTEKRNNLTQTNISLSSGAISLNTSSDYYGITPTSDTTFTFTNIPSGICTFELRIKLSTVYTLTFPDSVKWMNDTPPDMSETGIYFLVFRTEDGGTTWYANCQGKWSL